MSNALASRIWAYEFAAMRLEIAMPGVINKINVATIGICASVDDIRPLVGIVSIGAKLSVWLALPPIQQPQAYRFGLSPLLGAWDQIRLFLY